MIIPWKEIVEFVIGVPFALVYIGLLILLAQRLLKRLGISK